MCIFQRFFFLCNGDKLKISRPCQNTSVNVQGEIFCRDDPHPHIDDNTAREYDSPTHGPGVCSNIHCRWKWGLLPLGMFGANVAAGHHENDASFDMSEQACLEREDRWFRMLTTDQQLQCLKMTFPVPWEKMSLYAQAYFSQDTLQSQDVLFGRFDELQPDDLRWFELNPRYMNAYQLQYATGYLLPAHVTAPSNNPLACGSTPFAPLIGPFKPAPHVCAPVPGICRMCGRNKGEPKESDKQTEYECECLLKWRAQPPRPHEARDRQEIVKLIESVQEEEWREFERANGLSVGGEV